MSHDSMMCEREEVEEEEEGGREGHEGSREG